MNPIIKEKNKRLGHILSKMEKVMVAFSGGVDSTLVLKRAQQERGENVIAVVVNSELFRQEEFESAVKLAKSLNVTVYETEIKELAHPLIAANNPDSWYHSKKMLYSHLNNLADQLGYTHVLDGMIMDDIEDFRPGLRARTEANVRSVLQEAKFYKQDVRELAKHLNLPVWNKPASCSLASRIPYGEPLTLEKIQQINEAEKYLMALGFAQVRVRHHGSNARIEVTPDQIVKLAELRDKVEPKLLALGFTYVSIDLSGYQTGNMNKELSTDFVATDKVVNE